MADKTSLCSRYADWEGEQGLAEASQSYSFVPLKTFALDPAISAAFHGRHGTGFVPGPRASSTRDIRQPTQNPNNGGDSPR